MKILKNNYKIKYSACLKTLYPGIKLWLAKPVNLNYQKISDFNVSLVPESIYKDCHQNSILYFNFPREKEINLEASFWVRNSLFEKDINPAKITLLPKNSSISKFYTKDTKFLEQTKEIKKLAKSIIKDKKDLIEIIKEFFLFTIKNFKYEYPVKKRGVKNLNLNNLKGDCGQYSALFVVLCRTIGIPSRVNTGFVICPQNKKAVEHAWASIYLKPYGWLDIDTQYASLEKNPKTAFKKYFCKRLDNRIIFNIDYNIPIKPGIPRSYKTDYWKKQYMPITSNRVQIIQPLIFATKDKISSFGEKIELIY